MTLSEDGGVDEASKDHPVSPANCRKPPELFDQRQFLILVVFAGVGFGMTAPLTVLFASSFGAGDALAGLAVSSVALSLFVVDVFGTKLVPKVDGRFAVWFALVVFGLGSLASAAAPSLGYMIAARVLQGVGAAFFLGGALQVVVRFAPDSGAGRAIGAFNAAWFGGVAVGPLIGGFLASLGEGQEGYRLAFVCCGLVCFAVALSARFRLKRIPSSGAPRLSLPQRPRARPGLRMWPPLTLAGIGQGLRGGLVFTISPLLGERTLGLSTAGIGLALSLLAAVDIAAMRYGGDLADRIGRRKVLVGALLSGGAVCTFAPVVNGALGFGLWCSGIGVAVGIAWVVPVAVVVDVAQNSEDGLSAYRISSDVGQFAGSTGAGGMIAATGLVGSALLVGVGLAAVAGWVSRLPEASTPRMGPDAGDVT